MTKSGRREFFRRFSVMIIMVMAFVQTLQGQFLPAVALFVAAILFYVYLPTVAAPKHALRYDAGKSQIGPDWLGFMLSGLAIAFPISAAIDEPLWGTIHPSAVMLWPMALILCSFWVTGALHAAYWILIEPKALVISSAFSRREVPYSTIKSVRRYRRGLPKLISFMVPVMLASGQASGAGAVMLARDRTGMELVLKDKRRISIADGGYDEEIIEILQALDRHKVKLAAAFRTLLRKHAQA